MTARQVKAVKILVDKGGSMGKVLKEAGYSDAVVKTPAKVTKSQGWQDAMQAYGLTPERLLKKLNKGLDAKKTVSVEIKEDGKTIYKPTKEEDYAIQHKYLDTALKVAGAYSQEGGGSIHFHQHISAKKDSYQL